MVTARDVQAEHDLMLTLFERIVERVRKGDERAKTCSRRASWTASAARSTTRTEFLYDAHKGFWAHYNKLSHDIV